VPLLSGLQQRIGRRIKIAADRQAAQSVPDRATGLADTVVPKPLPLFPQQILDEAHGQRAVRRPPQQADRVGRHARSADRRHIRHDRRTPRRRGEFRLEPPVEIDDNAGRRRAHPDVIRDLAGRIRDVARVGADAPHQIDARQPPLLHRRLIGGRHACRHVVGQSRRLREKRLVALNLLTAETGLRHIPRATGMDHHLVRLGHAAALGGICQSQMAGISRIREIFPRLGRASNAQIREAPRVVADAEGAQHAAVVGGAAPDLAVHGSGDQHAPASILEQPSRRPRRTPGRHSQPLPFRLRVVVNPAAEKEIHTARHFVRRIARAKGLPQRPPRLVIRPAAGQHRLRTVCRPRHALRLEKTSRRGRVFRGQIAHDLRRAADHPPIDTGRPSETRLVPARESLAELMADRFVMRRDDD